jgi:flagellin
MALVINTNVAALRALRQLNTNTSGLNQSLERLSSGYRINRAADDAAGLQISENLRRQIRGVNQAISNSQDGNNMLSIAEGSLNVINDNLQRIRELTLQAANDTNSQTQRDTIAQEINQRLSDIDRIAQSADFNGQKILDGAFASFRLQVGPNNDNTLDTIDVGSALGAADTTALGITTAVFTSSQDARDYLTEVDTALDAVGNRLALVGAYQNQLDSAISNLEITRENYEAAESRIRNVDVARETSNLTRFQILQQVSASILAQANQTPALALTLLGR